MKMGFIGGVSALSARRPAQEGLVRLPHPFKLPRKRSDSPREVLLEACRRRLAAPFGRTSLEVAVRGFTLTVK